MRKLMMALVMSLVSVNFVFAATYCDLGVIDKAWNSGAEVNSITFTCSNNHNDTAVELSKAGNYFSISPSFPYSLQSGDSQLFTVNFDSDAPANPYFGYISFDDGHQNINVNLNVQEENEIYPSACQIRPSIGEYNQDYQQGAQVTETITFDPQNCVGDIIISGVNVQGGVVDSNGKRKPVSKGMITSDEINVIIDTEGLPSKTYDGIKLTFNAYGTQHTIRFKIGVTGSAGGSGTFDINNLPTCSLTNNILLLNNSYSMICTNIASDVTINPLIDNEYIIGTNFEQSDTQFIWYFKPLKQGNTLIKAQFKYLGVSVGEDYSQDVKIQSTGYSIEGTDLDLKFTPDLNLAIIGEEVLVQVVDNKTQSLVQSPRIWVDAVEINGTETFNFIFETDKEYEFRASVAGYNDLLQTISISNKIIGININPTSGDINTYFNISTSVENATLEINNVSYSNPYYGTIPVGLNLLKVSKEGYNSNYLNLTIQDYIRATKVGDIEFKKRVEQNFTLTGEPLVWIVYYQKNVDEDQEEYARGNGNIVSFIPKKSGIYKINADGVYVQNGVYEVKGFSFRDKWWFMPLWGWIILTIFIMGMVLFIVVRIRGGGGSSMTPGFKTQVSYE